MEGRGPPRASSMMIGRGTRNYARPIPIVSLHERRLPPRKHQVSGDTPGTSNSWLLRGNCTYTPCIRDTRLNPRLMAHVILMIRSE